MKHKVLSIVRNAYTNDARVDKTVTSLMKFGYNVTVLAQKAYIELPIYEKDRYPIFRIPLFSCIYAKMSNSSVTTISKNKENKWENKLFNKIKKNLLRQYIVSGLNTLSFNFLALIFGIIHKPHTIYVNDLDTLLVSYFISKFTGAKIIYDSHEIWFYGGVYNSASKLKQYLWRIIEKKLIHQVNAVIVTTDYRAEHMKKKYNLSEVFVIRNCPILQQVDYNNNLREEYNLSKTQKILIYQGLLKRVRGVFDIVDAVIPLKDAIVVFMGEGKDKEELFQYIKNRNMNDRIFIKDSVPYKEVLKVLASADIGLQPFHYTFNHYSVISNKLTECVMAGIAAIGSNFPEMKKVIEDNKIGLTHEEQNVSQLRNCIEKLVFDDEFLKMCKSNSIKARNKYAWEIDELVLNKILENI